LLDFSATIFICYLFSPPAIERLSSGLFQEVIITNTIPLKEEKTFPQLTILSVANLLGETIWRVHDDCSVSSNFGLIKNYYSSICPSRWLQLVLRIILQPHDTIPQKQLQFSFPV
jgi:hypothetical protein